MQAAQSGYLNPIVLHVLFFFEMEACMFNISAR
jgi:hypothetical protein